MLAQRGQYHLKVNCKLVYSFAIIKVKLEFPPFLRRGRGGKLNIMQVHNRQELKENRRNLRANLTPAEIRLWKCLQNKQLDGRKFRRQHSVGNYIVDFYCPEERIAIELDGNVHFNPVNEQYDRQRDENIESLGIKVVRFSNSDVFERIDNVLNEIRGHFR